MRPCRAATGLLLVLAAAAAKPPNFIVYLTDDLGLGELSQQNPQFGFPGNPFGTPVPNPGVTSGNMQRQLNTPYITQFAQQGMRGVLSYSPSAECAPSRAGLMVGRSTGTVPIRGDSTQPSNGLNPNLVETNIAQVLHAHAGYQAAIIGKWGLGSASGAPWYQGFNYFYGQLEHKEAWTCYPSQVWSWDGKVNPNTATVQQLLTTLPGNVQAMLNGAVITEANCPLAPNATCQHTNDLFRQQALAFLAKQTPKSAPFFLYWAPTAPHVGFYDPVNLLSSPVRRLGNRVGQMTQCRRGHAAQVEQHIDTDIGALLSLLQGKPWLDMNTLVVFSSDNGAQQDCQDDPAYSVSWFGATGGLRGYKRTMWEGGVRVPTMYRWPGVIEPGSVSTYPHSLYDLGATFLELAGISRLLLPKTGPLGGPSGAVSLVPMLLGNASEMANRPFMHLEWCNANQASMCYTATYDTANTNSPNWSANSSLYKLIVTPTNSLSLFDIIADPFETNDLSGQPQMQVEVLKLLVARQTMREPFCYGAKGCCYNSTGCTYLHQLDTGSPTTSMPSRSPTTPTSLSPSPKPTKQPSTRPTRKPTTSQPSSSAPVTKAPTRLPTLRPTSLQPTTLVPTTTFNPTLWSPTMSPTIPATLRPTPPTKKKKKKSTAKPTHRPSTTNRPSSTAPVSPTVPPTNLATTMPTPTPTRQPVPAPTTTTHPSRSPFKFGPTVSPTTYAEYINQHS